MKAWFKEVSKFFLNLALLTIAVFIYGRVSNPGGTSKLFIVGFALVVLFFILSMLSWRKGKDD